MRELSIEELIVSEERLRKLVADAEEKAEKIVADAREEAKMLVREALRKEVIDKFLVEEETKAKEEAKSVVKIYKNKVEEIRKISKTKFKKTVDLVLKEVLGI